jgi:hypothetical protein
MPAAALVRTNICGRRCLAKLAVTGPQLGRRGITCGVLLYGSSSEGTHHEAQNSTSLLLQIFIATPDGAGGYSIPEEPLAWSSPGATLGVKFDLAGNLYIANAPLGLLQVRQALPHWLLQQLGKTWLLAHVAKL